MNKFLVFLLIIFIVIFVIERSNLFEKTTVYDAQLGVEKEEYHLKWNNLQEYFIDIADHSRNSLKELKKIIPHRQ